MKVSSILLLLFSLIINFQCDDILNESIIPDYDSYVLAIQWGNNYCKDSNTICINKQKETEKNVFTIHGLWPSLKNGEMLSVCTETENNIEVHPDGSSLYAHLRKVWPSIHDKNSDRDFWSYEYNKHGNCYVYKYKKEGYKDYFYKTLDVYYQKELRYLFQRIFPNQTEGEITLTLDELILKINKGFPNQVYKLICNRFTGNKLRLIDIYLYYDLDFNPFESNVKHSCAPKEPIIIKFN